LDNSKVVLSLSKQIKTNKMEAKKRNVVKMNEKGDFLKIGLTKKAKQTLEDQRDILSRYVNIRVVDQYIIALYDEDSNDVYFVNESQAYGQERAIIS
jgi:hypothetical protein